MESRSDLECGKILFIIFCSEFQKKVGGLAERRSDGWRGESFGGVELDFSMDCNWISQWIATHLGKRENLMTGVFVALYCIKSIKDTASRVEACAEYFISTVRCPIPHPIRRYNPIQSVHPSTSVFEVFSLRIITRD